LAFEDPNPGFVIWTELDELEGAGAAEEVDPVEAEEVWEIRDERGKRSARSIREVRDDASAHDVQLLFDVVFPLQSPQGGSRRSSDEMERRRNEPGLECSPSCA